MSPEGCCAGAKPVVLLTDFGPHSAYVGQIKLALEQLAPGIRVLDLAHDLPPQQLAAATLVVRSSLPLLPPACILCVIVDPGVGSERKIVAARFANGLTVLAPDNGLLHALAPLFPPLQLHELREQAYFLPGCSSVFHGRDRIAPVAARLACGLDLTLLGPPLEPSTLQGPCWPACAHSAGGIAGEVVYCDRFGNLVSNIPTAQALQLAGSGGPFPDRIRVEFSGAILPLLDHYAQAQPGASLALPGSFGFLEIAVRDGSAQARFAARIGAPVHCRPCPV